MTRVCMITLTDVRNDLRIRKEAESLARHYAVHVVSLIDDLQPGTFAFRGLNVINVRLRTRRLPKSPVFWLIKYVEFVMRAGWAARRVRARVYHGHEIAGSIPALLAARSRRAKFIYDAHELEADRAGHIEKTPWLRRMLLWSLRFVMRRADHVICASESRADIMLADYGARERPTPILNVTPRAGLPVQPEPRASACATPEESTVPAELAISSSTAYARHRQSDLVQKDRHQTHRISLHGQTSLPMPPERSALLDPPGDCVEILDDGRPVDLTGKRVVIYQGTLAPGRGLDRVVAALRNLDDDIALMILGRGSTFHELIAQAERDGTRHRLIMVGQVPADALVRYMNRADVGLAIYLNTCRNNYHCAPNKIYEYASVGLPVVAPNFPDVESVISQYDIGCTFDPESHESIAEAIRTVLGDAARRKSMSCNALALKEYVNWEGQERRLGEIYECLIEPHE